MCFTVDVLLTHRVTSGDKEPLSARGCFRTVTTQSSGRVSPECGSPGASTARCPSPRQQGHVPTFGAGGALNKPLVARTGPRISAGQGKRQRQRQRQGPPSTPGPRLPHSCARRGCAPAGAAKGARRPGASPAVTGEMERHPRRGRGWSSLPGPSAACQGHAPPLPSRGAPEGSAAPLPPPRYLHGGAGRLQGRGDRGATAAASAATSSPSRFRLRHPGSPGWPGPACPSPSAAPGDGRGSAEGPLPRSAAGTGPGGESVLLSSSCSPPYKKGKGRGYGWSMMASRCWLCCRAPKGNAVLQACLSLPPQGEHGVKSDVLGQKRSDLGPCF